MGDTGTSWGGYPRASQRVSILNDRDAPLPPFEGRALPYGNGRSYGDSCLNDGGTLLHAAGLDRYIRFDEATGVLECEAGLSLAEIVAGMLPRGWFLPVTPGTQHVTVGGAIANDVHGKNHHHHGSFGEHVLELELLRSDGSRRVCGPGQEPEWFAATLGGLGLTGVVTRARLQLRRVPGPWVQATTRRFADLGEFFALSEATSADEYSVAWVDCLASGKQLGRGVFTHANHVAATATARPARPRLAFPFTPPFSLVNPLSLRLFNQLYYRRSPAVPRTSVGHFAPFFYPLDAIGHWNRMYGPRGLLQYQCVVPPEVAAPAISEILQRIASHGSGSFLAVLKKFGSRRSAGMLSFPRPGTTLALDFPNRGATTLRLLDELDRVVMQARGAVYPAKDARMSAAMFAVSFPRLPEFLPYVDPRFSSGLWRRVMVSG
ncbi:MAG: FAD-binding oxidoreductase [Lysobacteraceae bacterium]|nr:MAG: FAD-binding oxidoreductase [Xanthomonadaceae bacterium]